ncbi:hypothetical protein OIU84_015446, partial [Salix udensis]
MPRNAILYQPTFILHRIKQIERTLKKNKKK